MEHMRAFRAPRTEHRAHLDTAVSRGHSRAPSSLTCLAPLTKCLERLPCSSHHYVMTRIGLQWDQPLLLDMKGISRKSVDQIWAWLWYRLKHTLHSEL